MQSRSCGLLPHAAAIPFAIALNLLWVGSASAHVKWFCAYDVAGQPRGLENVLCQEFELIIGIAVFALLSRCLFEGTWIGDAQTRALDRVTAWLRPNTELMFRSAGGAFFVSLWVMGGVLLKPEIKTDFFMIQWLKLAI